MDFIEFNILASRNPCIEQVIDEDIELRMMPSPYKAFQNCKIYTDVYNSRGVNASILRMNGITYIGDKEKIQTELAKQEGAAEWGNPKKNEQVEVWGNNSW